MLFSLIGGIGIFLVGMLLLTDGLKTVAGSGLRAVLQRFTGNRIAAVLSGALITGLVQSSSATTLATIGFVSAGLLGFQAAVGVIFGANLGTTSTGWIVSTLGLKVRIAEWTLPFIGVGALAWLTLGGRRAAAGMALAGFGLVFVGIGTLQSGMADLAERIDPGSFGGGAFAGRLLLVGVGIVMTVAMQSSSAAIATTLAAVDAGAITLEEAAALAIGQNVGTTVTAGVAAVGATTAARRTALAHVLFNVITGLVALALLPGFVELSRDVADDGDPAMALAAFHTVFNVSGVLLLLPLLGPFTRTVERLVPDRGPRFLANLDSAVAGVPDIALDAARRSAAAIGVALLGRAGALTAGRSPARTAEDPAMALEPLAQFAARIDPGADPATRQRSVSLLHAIDHLHRLAELTAAPPPRAPAEHFPRRTRQLVAALETARQALDDPGDTTALEELAGGAAALVRWREHRRRRLIEEAAGPPASGELVQAVARDVRSWPRRLFGSPRADAPAAAAPAPGSDLVARLDTMLWMARVAYHAWRLAAHLAACASGEPAPRAAAEPA